MAVAGSRLRFFSPSHLGGREEEGEARGMGEMERGRGDARGMEEGGEAIVHKLHTTAIHRRALR